MPLSYRSVDNLYHIKCDQLLAGLVWQTGSTLTLLSLTLSSVIIYFETSFGYYLLSDLLP